MIVLLHCNLANSRAVRHEEQHIVVLKMEILSSTLSHAPLHIRPANVKCPEFRAA